MASMTAAAISGVTWLERVRRLESVAFPPGIREASRFSRKFVYDDGGGYLEDEEDFRTGRYVAVGADLEPILEMSRRFYATTDDAKHVPMCEETVRELIAACGGGNGVLLIAEHDGLAVGFFAGLIVPGMFNADKKALHEVAWYLTPEYMGHGYGVKLLKTADAMRKALGCWKFEKATLPTSPPIASEILLKEGFAPSYNSFMKVD
jgi:GNAT superfamily N-acetyltransferase